jgi:hypothetical protein
MQEREVDPESVPEEDSNGFVDTPQPSPTSPEGPAESPGSVAEELKDAAPDVAKPAEPVVMCDFCGPVRGPKAEVYQCQLCMKDFCIKHVDPFFHMCPSSRQS